MKNKITKIVMVMASREDGYVQFSTSLYNSEEKALETYKEIWKETHYLLNLITLEQTEIRENFLQEAVEADVELEKILKGVES